MVDTAMGEYTRNRGESQVLLLELIWAFDKIRTATGFAMLRKLTVDVALGWMFSPLSQ
jgi:hypothetical protein